MHVVPHKAGWAVRTARGKKFLSLHSSKAGAIVVAKKLAKKECSEVVIQRKGKSSRVGGKVEK